MPKLIQGAAGLSQLRDLLSGPAQTLFLGEAGSSGFSMPLSQGVDLPAGLLEVSHLLLKIFQFLVGTNVFRIGSARSGEVPEVFVLDNVEKVVVFLM